MSQAEHIARAVYEGFECARPDMVAEVRRLVASELPDEKSIESRVKQASRDILDELTSRAVERLERTAGDAVTTKAEAIRASLEAELIRRVSDEVARIPVPKDGHDGRDGRDGRDGDSVYWRGEYRDGKGYGQFDVVHRNGAAYIARRATNDDPAGQSEDWGLLVSKGDQGERGNGVRSVEVRGGRLLVHTDDFPNLDAGDVTGPQGPQGEKGDMGPGFKFRAKWNPAKTYGKQEVVTWNRASWVAATELRGVEPGKDARWRMLTPPGERGKRGAAGPEGRGIQSIRGDMGKAIVTFTDGGEQEISVDGVPVWRGEWDGGQEYVNGDVVRAGNAVWICVSEAPVSNSAPSNESVDWDVMLRAPRATAAGGGGGGLPQFPKMTLDKAAIDGRTASDPYPVQAGFNRIIASSVGSAIQLPRGEEGQWVVVSLGTADDVEIYPPAGGQINWAGADVPYLLSNYASPRIACVDADLQVWITW